MHATDELTRRLFAIFLAGWVVGFIAATILAGQDADFGGVYNPVRYYRQMVQLQASPWSLLSPDLSAKLRDSRREILGGTAAAVITPASSRRPIRARPAIKASMAPSTARPTCGKRILRPPAQ